MNIAPVMNYGYSIRNYAKKQDNNKVSFKAELSSKDLNRVLKMLTSCPFEIKRCGSFNEFTSIIQKLASKYDNIETKGIGVVPVSGKELSQITQGKNINIDLGNDIGIFVAVGDKNGPAEIWNKAYESILAILPKSELTRPRPNKVIIMSPGPKGIN